MSQPDHPDTAVCYLTNATSCSAGTGPGYATLPWDEAQWLIGEGLAVAGTSPPPNMGTAGQPVNPP
jgi:hypothetical protein